MPAISFAKPTVCSGRRGLIGRPAGFGVHRSSGRELRREVDRRQLADSTARPSRPEAAAGRRMTPIARLLAGAESSRLACPRNGGNSNFSSRRRTRQGPLWAHAGSAPARWHGRERGAASARYGLGVRQVRRRQESIRPAERGQIAEEGPVGGTCASAALGMAAGQPSWEAQSARAVACAGMAHFAAPLFLCARPVADVNGQGGGLRRGQKSESTYARPRPGVEALR